MKTRMMKMPTEIYNERKKVADILKIPKTKAFIVYDKIICEVVKSKKTTGRLKLDIKWHL